MQAVVDAITSPFKLEEMKWSICKSGLTAPGKDQICYIMLEHLSDIAYYIYITMFGRKEIYQEAGNKLL